MHYTELNLIILFVLKPIPEVTDTYDKLTLSQIPLPSF